MEYQMQQQTPQSRLKKIAADLSALSSDLLNIDSTFENTVETNDKLTNQYLSVFSQKEDIIYAKRFLEEQVVKKSLLAPHPASSSFSITVSGTVAVGLERSGSHEYAQILVENIRKCQIKSGQDRGAYSPPLSNGGVRPPHNMSNFWALYSSLIVSPDCVDHTSTQDVIRFLLDEQREGAWGLTKSHTPKPYYTAHVLLALLEYYQLTEGHETMRPKNIENAIVDSVNYLCKIGDLKSLQWPEYEKKHSPFHLPSSAITIRALSKYKKLFGKEIYSDDQLNQSYHLTLASDLEKLLILTDVNLWPEVKENEIPTYHAWLSISDAVVCFLDAGIHPLETSIIKSLNWIEKHVVRHEGIIGIDAGAPDTGKIANWSTGHSLIAINLWEDLVLKRMSYSEIISRIIKDENTNLTLNSKRYIEELNQRGQEKEYWKKIAISAMITSAFVGFIMLFNYGVQNFVEINSQIQSGWVLLKKIASNEIVNFTFGLLGFLPIAVATIRWLLINLGKKSE